VSDDDLEGAGVLPARLSIVTLCTDNAARSVMAGSMLEVRAEAEGLALKILTAGTHSVDGQPMSARTRSAMMAIDALESISYGRHRSHQLTDADLVGADLVMAMEADHVRYVRRHHPQAAGRTATLIRLCATMSSGPQPFAERMAACGFGEVELGDDEDVADPAGGDEGVYLVCARQLWELTGEFIALL